MLYRNFVNILLYSTYARAPSSVFIYTTPYRHGDRSRVACGENGRDAKFLSFGTLTSKIRVRFNTFGYSIDIFGELTNDGTARRVI